MASLNAEIERGEKTGAREKERKKRKEKRKRKRKERHPNQI